MVTGKRLQPLVAQLTDRIHTFLADVSPANGGTDKGPTPHELIESGLVACTIITVQMYANRHGWKLDSTDVEVKILSEGETSVFSRKITFKGDLTQEQKTRLFEIAEKCPVHRLLTSQITIQSERI